jgi:hypothetical protein
MTNQTQGVPANLKDQYSHPFRKDDELKLCYKKVSNKNNGVKTVRENLRTKK